MIGSVILAFIFIFIMIWAFFCLPILLPCVLVLRGILKVSWEATFYLSLAAAMVYSVVGVLVLLFWGFIKILILDPVAY